MSPKIIETKLVISGEDKASASLQKITDNLGKVAEKLSALGQVEFPSFEGHGVGRAVRGAGRTAVAAQRSPHAPATAGQIGLDSVKSRGGTGYGGRPYFGFRGAGPGAFALGVAGRAPSMMGSLISGAAGGSGLAAVGGMMQQAGGGIMGAFGGLGAVAGIGMLGLGVTMGLLHTTSRTAMEYRKATAMIGTRLGTPYLDRMRGIGVGAGIDPMEMLQHVAQLERTGAQRAFPAIADLKRFGISPEMSLPFFGALGRAGGPKTEAGALGIAKILGFQAKDIHSLPLYLDQLVSMTGTMEQHMSDLTDQGTDQLLAIGKWMQASPSAALKGERGGRTFAKLMNWVAEPGEPGKEMLLWGMLANNPEFRAKMALSSGKGGIGLPAGQQPSHFQMLKMRGTPAAWAATIKDMSQWDPELAGLFMTYGMGFKAQEAETLLGQARKMDIEPFEKEVAAAREKGMIPGPAEDPGVAIVKSITEMQNALVEAFSPKALQTIVDTEKTIVLTLAKIFDEDTIEGIANSVKQTIKLIESIMAGDYEGIKKAISEGIKEGFKLLLPVTPATPQEYLTSIDAQIPHPITELLKKLGIGIEKKGATQ